jgi:hypothetical protein
MAEPVPFSVLQIRRDAKDIFDKCQTDPLIVGTYNQLTKLIEEYDDIVYSTKNNAELQKSLTEIRINATLERIKSQRDTALYNLQPAIEAALVSANTYNSNFIFKKLYAHLDKAIKEQHIDNITKAVNVINDLKPEYSKNKAIFDINPNAPPCKNNKRTNADDRSRKLRYISLNAGIDTLDKKLIIQALYEIKTATPKESSCSIAGGTRRRRTKRNHNSRKSKTIRRRRV